MTYEHTTTEGVGEPSGRGTSSLLMRQTVIVDPTESGFVLAKVPLDLIRHEEVPVELSQIATLATSAIRSTVDGSGSTSREVVELAEIPGQKKFTIIEGFHQVPALRMAGIPTWEASIMRDVSEEEVVDMRILTTNSDSSSDLQLERRKIWVNEAWRMTDWASRINAAEAFSLHIGLTNPVDLPLATSEIEAIRLWAEQKALAWGISPTLVFEALVHQPGPIRSLGEVALSKIIPGELGSRSVTSDDPLKDQKITPNHRPVTRKVVTLERTEPVEGLDRALIAYIVSGETINGQRPSGRSVTDFPAFRRALQATSGRDLAQDPEMLERFTSVNSDFISFQNSLIRSPQS